MKIYNSEDFLKSRLIEESSYPLYLSERLKTKPLDERESFDIYLHSICKSLYEGMPLKKKELDYIKSNFKKQNGWYSIDKPFGKGSFINANAILGVQAYCQEEKCHTNAYKFATTYHGDTCLVFGTINPFNINNGLFHSIVLFDYKGKEYVFDGANYVVMEKELYESVFKFQEIQRITKNVLLKDKRTIKTTACLKKNQKVKLIRYQSLVRRFYGLGFIAYLYNRQDFLANTDKQYKNIKIVREDYSQFERQLKDIEDSYEPITINLDEINRQ